MARKKNRFFALFNVVGECENRVAGQLFDKYLKGGLSPEEDKEFREHLLDCLRCAATLTNARVMRQASAYYGIEPGPELDKRLGSITLVKPPQKYKGIAKDVTRKLMAIKRDTIN